MGLQGAKYGSVRCFDILAMLHNNQPEEMWSCSVPRAPFTGYIWPYQDIQDAHHV